MLKAAIAAGLFSLLASAQDSTPVPRFEVAEVRVSSFDALESAAGNVATIANLRSDAAHLVDTNVRLRGVVMAQLLALAYRETILKSDYLSGPGWLRSDRFDVIAKAPPGSSAAAERWMLQSLLAQRFHLELHIQQKRMRVFALVVAKKGPKLRPALEAPERACQGPAGNPAQGSRAFTCRNVTLAFVAERLQRLAGLALPVIDETGLSGSYDIDFIPPRGMGGMMLSFEFANQPLPPEFFKAWEDQLGLKVEEQIRPMPVVVVDHMDRIPSEN